MRIKVKQFMELLPADVRIEVYHGTHEQLITSQEDYVRQFGDEIVIGCYMTEIHNVIGIYHSDDLEEGE